MAASETRWWSKDTVAVVTGGNKGIGYEIVKSLLKNGVTTVLTARDQGRGKQAIDSLKLQGFDGIFFHALDVTSAQSAEDLANWLKKEFGGIDILINNAGIYIPGVSYEAAKAVLETNYYGVKIVTEKLLPLMKSGARIVNVSSELGLFSHFADSPLVKVFDDESNLSEEVVDSYAKKYLEAVKAGSWKEDGWSHAFPMYGDSKILLNAYTRSFAKTLRQANQSGAEKIYVNAICPGFVATDLNNHMGHGTAEQGADTPVWLALLDDQNYPNGKFFKSRVLIPF